MITAKPNRLHFLIAALLLQCSALAQKVYYNTTNAIYVINYKDGICSRPKKIPYNSKVNPDGVFSIAVHNDTIYYVSRYRNNLYRVTENDSSTCTLLDYFTASNNNQQSTANGLVCDKDGNLYAIDVNQSLSVYNPHSGRGPRILGTVPAIPSGDLMFYKNKLLYASAAGLFEVNIAAPEQSKLYMATGDYLFIGLVSLAYGCNQNKVYGIAARDTNSVFAEIDLDKKSIVAEACSIPYNVYDAASSTDDGNTRGVTIDSILFHPSCDIANPAGAIHINASTATPGGLVFTLDKTNTNSTGLFQGIPLGPHAVHITTADGCMLDSSFAFKQGLVKAGVGITVTADDGCTSPTGSITVQASTPYMPVAYSLNNKVPIADSSFTGLSAGSYTLAIKDAVGCAVDTSAAIIRNKPSPFVSGIDVADTKCLASNGTIQMHVGAGTDSTGVSSKLNNGAVTYTLRYTKLDEGLYALHATDEAGCTFDTALHIARLPGIKPTINIATTGQLCFANNGSAAFTIQGNEGPYNTSINNAAFTTQTAYGNLAPGNYGLSIKNSTFCVWDTAFTIAAYKKFPDDVAIAKKSPGCSTPQGGAITVNITGTQQPYSFLYNGASYPSGNTLGGLGAGNYMFTVANGDGCIIDTTTVSLQPVFDAGCDTVYVPGAFTPNNDAHNDFLKPVTSSFVTVVDFIVYNRFGQAVFKAQGNNIAGWDGRVNGRLQPVGTYIWHCIYNNFSNQPRHIKGTTVLIR